MDFQPTQAMAKIRSEIREILAAELPRDWLGGSFLAMETDRQAPDVMQRLNRSLAAKNLLTPAWPEKYGGRGLTPYEHFALLEEMAYAMVPVNTIAVDLVGTILLLYGSEEQRQRFLPPIAKEGEIWCQGFSEPGSGSDLTSLRTRAERTGDFYVVNGQKIWTSGAHHAAWMILLARTSTHESRGRGLSLFLVPMDLSGIRVRHIHDMAGEHMLNEVFVEDVQIPVENLVGNENEGWRYATTLLQYERGDALWSGHYRRFLDDLREELREQRLDGSRSRIVRSLMAQCEIDYQVARLFSLRVVNIQARGQSPDMEASISKVFMTEATQRLTRIAHHFAGLYGNVWGKNVLVPLEGRIAQSVMGTTALTILGGTSEIQRTIIATRGLGLPRG
jgi:alkylation response protein AidB-like acyl-CoA dehydrogenase